MSYTILFLTAPSPGQVFRYFERNRFRPAFVDSLLISDPANDVSIRCLFTEEQVTQITPILDWMQSLGGSLSQIFSPRVTLLWYCDVDFSHLTRWGFTIWEAGVAMETAEHTIEVDSKPSLLSRLPGMKRTISQRPDIAWALSHGLPIDRVPAAGLRRHIPIIDYVTVAQLDQRSLLVENTPRLYRFPLNNS